MEFFGISLEVISMSHNYKKCVVLQMVSTVFNGLTTHTHTHWLFSIIGMFLYKLKNSILYAVALLSIVIFAFTTLKQDEIHPVFITFRFFKSEGTMKTMQRESVITIACAGLVHIHGRKVFWNWILCPDHFSRNKCICYSIARKK